MADSKHEAVSVSADRCDGPPRAKGRNQTEQDKELQNFYRHATKDQRDKHKAMRKHTVEERARFRADCQAINKDDVNATASKVTDHSKKQRKVGTYRSKVQIAEKEGALVCPQTGWRVADNTCAALEPRGLQIDHV